MTQTAPRRQQRLVIQGPEAGYHQNWHALGFARDIANGQVVGKDFLGSRVVVYRGEDGQVRVMSAYCRHLGAELSAGCVVGNDVQCGFHHWQYGPDGRCTKIPASETIPEPVRLFRFPVAEKWGLIWAFVGEEPLYDVPGFRGYEDSELEYRTIEAPYLIPTEQWVPLTNSHDYQHLHALHDQKLAYGPVNMNNGPYLMEHDMAFEMPGGMLFANKIRVTGTNTISLTGEMAGGIILSMFSGALVGDQLTKGYIINATPRVVDGVAQDPAVIETRIGMAEAFFVGLIEEDTPIMNTIRFREGVLLEADRELALFLDHVRRFPKANPLADYD